MGHSEESGEAAGELNDAFFAGRNALNVLKSVVEIALIRCCKCNPRMGYSAPLRMTVLKLVK